MKFTWQDVGVVVSILIGLPTFLGLFLDDKWIPASLILIAIGLAVYFVWILKEPEITILSVEKTLVVKNKQGTKAVLTSRIKGRCNHKGLTEFWFNGIGASGTVEDIRIDRQKPNRLEPTLGTLRACKRFPAALQRGDTFAVEISYALIDSFTESTESLIHSVDYATKYLTMKVVLPAARRCSKACSYRAINHHPQCSIEDPEVAADNREIILQIKRPKLARQYVVEWDW